MLIGPNAIRRKWRLSLSRPFNAVVIVVEVVLCPYWAARTDTLDTLYSFFALSSWAEESTRKLIYIVRWAATIIAHAPMIIFIGIWNFQLPHLFCWTVIYVVINVLRHKYEYNTLTYRISFICGITSMYGDDTHIRDINGLRRVICEFLKVNTEVLAPPPHVLPSILLLVQW